MSTLPGDRRPLHTAAIGIFEVAGAFLRLGCISFGGPIAHLGYLRNEFVARRRWLDDAAYADLVALCQFLPGPASSQVVFALGMRRAGLRGALVASTCFTLPSVLLMLGFASSVAHIANLAGAGWLHGLKLAAVAVVVQAVWGMGQKLCTDALWVALALGAAAALLAIPGVITQLAVIATGAVVGWWWYRVAGAVNASAQGGDLRRRHGVALAALGTFVALLLLLPVLAAQTGAHDLAVFDSFYRSGALVFGGGHVVLPLLRAEGVPPGWLTDAQFLAGYGAAQALPGPLFAFAAYLGATMQSGAASWRYGLWCVFAIFLPAWLLVGGVLPFWQRLRARPWAQAALAGANATVVGVLLAALVTPVGVESLHDARDVMAAAVAFGLLQLGKAPPWLVVGGCAAAGQWLLGA